MNKLTGRLTFWMIPLAIFTCITSSAQNEISPNSRQERIDKKSASLKNYDWIKLALNLSGESAEIEHKAKLELKKTKDLDSILRKELSGPYQGLALDVIVTLEKKELLKDLLALSANDDSGFVAQAINNLLDDKNVQTVVQTYLQRIGDQSLARPSAATKVAMLDTFTRLHVALSPELYSHLFQDESFEVRYMALRSLLGVLKTEKKQLLLASLREAFTGHPYQLRLAALLGWKELPLELQKESSQFLNTCTQDSNMSLRAECQDVIDHLPKELSK